MNLTKVHLFVILLLALVLCSFLGGSCGDAGLEGFNMPSDSSPYKGKRQDSDQFSSYGKMYSANKQYAKGQDALYDRKDKPLPPSSDMGPQDDSDDSRYASFTPNSGSGASSASADANGASSASGTGIPASQIIPGQEDLYMLKSSIVPPVCPACPSVKCNNNSKNGGGNNSTPAKCPPCPPCARCPEPSFECKKVPNYNLTDNNVLPRPVLSSFSQFGM
jgi:hypothetical protein